MVFHAKNPLFDSLMIKGFFLLNGLVGQNMDFWNSVSVPKNNFQSRIKDLDYPSLGVIYGPQINEYQGWPEIKRFLPKNNRIVACRKPRISHYFLHQGGKLHDRKCSVYVTLITLFKSHISHRKNILGYYYTFLRSTI